MDFLACDALSLVVIHWHNSAAGDVGLETSAPGSWERRLRMGFALPAAGSRPLAASGLGRWTLYEAGPQGTQRLWFDEDCCFDQLLGGFELLAGLDAGTPSIFYFRG